MRRVVVLGATGSIGRQALEVIERSPHLSLAGLAAGRSWEPLLRQAREHGVQRVALTNGEAASHASRSWPEAELFTGPDGLERLISACEPDIVLNAIVGAAGLASTIATLRAGVDLALANKESLVVGGDLVMRLAARTGAAIVPVDSEHSALHQLLQGTGPRAVDRLLITASGGPFRGMRFEDTENATVERALAHPTWAMGGKITIDSATLMNKGLEVIEAHHLFDWSYDRIDVVVHPQSIVHGLLEFRDGVVSALLGAHDMRVPISYALHFPERVDAFGERLDMASVGSLQFEPVDHEAFPCLGLARAAAVAGGTAPCVLNASNEVAVDAFLNRRLRFGDIPRVVEECLAGAEVAEVSSFDALTAADAEARRAAQQLVKTLETAAS
jgi:1-deoxy-D-xylulose-5-phosphate reductoisomerase